MKTLTVYFGFLSLLFTLNSSFAQAQLGEEDYHLDSDDLSFTYQDFEGTTYIRCTHEIDNQLGQNWFVYCGDRVYSVHVWITKYERSVEPLAIYELIYWVTEYTSDKNPLPSSGATTWFKLTDDAGLHSIMTRQSVENDLAGLYLEIF